MIQIQERRCEKLSGLTSLFLSFGDHFDNAEIFYNMMQCVLQKTDIHNYNKKTKECEVPVTYLANLLDSLSLLDDVEVSLYQEKPKEDIKLNLDFNYKLKPFEHQKEAILFGLSPEHEKWLLLDDMGLGKTASIIHIAEELKKQGKIKHCLIICGIATLRGNWKKEIKLHSNESVRIIGEKVNTKGITTYMSVRDRVEQVLNPLDEFFIIVNVETLRSTDFIDALRYGHNDFDMIVVDEVHKAANKNSIQGANLLKIDSKYKIAATGTLLTNAPINAFLPLKWLGIDKATLTNYKKQYCEFGGFGGHEIVGYRNLDILKEEIDKNSLRRTKEILKDSLPTKTIIKEIVTLSDEHRKFYDNVKKGVKEECNKVELNRANVLALTTRLRQATACPQILTTNPVKSSKLERCVELTEDLVSRGEKVVIFSTFKESVRYIEEELKKYNPLICTGNSTDDEINKNIDLFQQDPTYKIIIATHQKMGTGVTLNAASYMIFIDTPFTAAAFNQSCDRIYRIGTKRPVFIYNLICEDTIDERVSKIIEAKEAMSDYVIDDKLSDDSFMLLRKYILDL